MGFPLHLSIPAVCALLYVWAALALRRAALAGVGVWRTSFVANWMIAAVFVPWWFWRGGTWHAPAEYWQPALTALTFLGGQIAIFLALQDGEVSVTTPVMGTKVLLVAMFSQLLHAGAVPWLWWMAAALSPLAVVLLQAGEPRGRRRHVARTIFLSVLSAGSYALTDVLLQKWVPVWGSGSYLPPMFLLTALYSFAFVPFFRGPLRALTGEAWRWVGLGAFLLAVNNAGIVLAIALWGGATAVNIVYSARGLVSVALVFALGYRWSEAEPRPGRRVLGFRLAGAALMLAAIALVLV